MIFSSRRLGSGGPEQQERMCPDGCGQMVSKFDELRLSFEVAELLSSRVTKRNYQSEGIHPLEWCLR